MSPWIYAIIKVVFAAIVLYLLFLIAKLFLTGTLLSAAAIVGVIIFILIAAEAVGMRR